MHPLHTRRRFLHQAVTAGLALPAATRLALGQSAPTTALSRFLFLDDAFVESGRGFERIFHRPKKAGLIEESDGQPWQLGDQTSVVRDPGGQFHMTYRVAWPDPGVRDLHPDIGGDKAHWFRQSTAYAFSEDGIKWTRPTLGLIDGPLSFQPAPEAKWKDGVFFEPTAISRDNNLGCPIHLIHDLQEFGNVTNPSRRYLINFLQFADTHPFAEVTDGGLYFAGTVPAFVGNPRWRDGLSVVWEGPRRGPRGPATRVAGWDPQWQLWFDCAQSPFGEWQQRSGRDISRWTSKDFQNWSNAELAVPVREDESRKPEDWVEYMDFRAFPVNDFWLGQLIVFHGDRRSDQAQMPNQRGVWRKGTTEMRLLLSRDAGRTWRRLGSTAPWIPHHEAEAGFDRLVFTASPVHVADELWLYYACWDGDHLVWNRDGTPYYPNRARVPRTARAVLRWDGFVSLRAGADAAEMLSKPITSRQRLTVNAAVSAGGSLKAEVLGPDGLALSNFKLKDCTAVTGNGVALPLTWGGKEELPRKHFNKPVRLRFEFSKTDFFGFQWV